MENKLLDWGLDPSVKLEENLEESKGKFIGLKIKNAKQLHDWYSNQGLEMLPVEELHCTLAYSKKDFKHTLNTEDIIVPSCNIRDELFLLGLEDKVVVLKFDSELLSDRFQICIEEGAVFDFLTYQPHITLSIAKVKDISKFVKPDFDIILCNEYENELIEDYQEKIKEKLEK